MLKQSPLLVSVINVLQIELVINSIQLLSSLWNFLCNKEYVS